MPALMTGTRYSSASTFVDAILKGAKPQDLPVELPAKFQVIVNKKTARALKLALPPTMVQQAAAVID